MPKGHDTIIEVSNIMSFVLYTQILKQSVLKPASPGITLTISCNFQILALIGFSVFHDLHFWSTDLKIQGRNGRSVVYAQAKFHCNSLQNMRENALQYFLRGCLLVTLN